jgi:hypothetical protein
LVRAVLASNGIVRDLLREDRNIWRRTRTLPTHFQRRATTVVNVRKLRAVYGKHVFLENASVDARCVFNGLNGDLEGALSDLRAANARFARGH